LAGLAAGQRVKLHTHHLVREDTQALYGFKTTEELAFFELITTVSGVGPKVGLAIVSSRPVADLQLAILQGDDAVLTAVSGDVVASLVIAAGLAALMSTMDSQLLTLSSIFTRDILPLFHKKPGKNSISGRIFVICLSLLGLLLAYRPPATILQIATQTFTGLAVLFPTVIFGLYFKRVYALPAILSILCGEAAVLVFYLKWLSPAGFLPVVWVMATAFTVYLIVHLSIRLNTTDGGLKLQMPSWLKNPYTYLLGGIFFLGNDIWAWGKVHPVIFGLPVWLWYFVGLSMLQVLVMVFLIRSEEQEAAPAARDHRRFV
jgi:SSS family solute:Na+ symporter